MEWDRFGVSDGGFISWIFISWVRPELLGFIRWRGWAADLGQTGSLFPWLLYLNDTSIWLFSSVLFALVLPHLLLPYSGYLRNGHSCLARKPERGAAELKPYLCTETRAGALPAAVPVWASPGKIISSRVNFSKLILKSVTKPEQTDVGLYSRHCEELVFHQQRHQITVNTECFRYQTSSLHPMQLLINQTNNYSRHEHTAKVWPVTVCHRETALETPLNTLVRKPVWNMPKFQVIQYIY